MIVRRRWCWNPFRIESPRLRRSDVARHVADISIAFCPLERSRPEAKPPVGVPNQLRDILIDDYGSRQAYESI